MMYGIEGTAALITGIYIFPMMPIDTYLIARTINVSPVRVFREVSYPLVASLGMAAAVTYVYQTVTLTGPVLEFILLVLVGIGVYVALAWRSCLVSIGKSSRTSNQYSMRWRDQNETDNPNQSIRRKEEHSAMKRRTVLAGVVPFLQVGRWLDQLLLVNQGEIVQKRFVGIAEGETTEITVTDDDGTTVSSEHEGQLGQSPAEISPEVATPCGKGTTRYGSTSQ